LENIVVTTKEELKTAQESKVDEIIVAGALADKLYKAKKIAKLGKKALMVVATAIGVGVALAPASGGTSLAVSGITAVGVGATTGVGTAAIIAASAIGLALVLAIFEGYEEISYESGKLVLRKKQV
jgi:MFS family permease